MKDPIGVWLWCLPTTLEGEISHRGLVVVLPTTLEGEISHMGLVVVFAHHRAHHTGRKDRCAPTHLPEVAGGVFALRGPFGGGAAVAPCGV